jgi:hypothetical protein
MYYYYNGRNWVKTSMLGALLNKKINGYLIAKAKNA